MINKLWNFCKVKNTRVVFFFLLTLLLISKLLVLLNYGFKYTGSDNMVFWLAARDYAEGIFHEPYFYGQNYNVLLEAIFALPFIKAGLPFHFALPLSTVIIGVFPFVFFSIVLYKRGYFINSYLFLLIPIALPIEYDILTTMTRGFINGLFFCSFLIYCILEPNKVRSFIVLGLSVSFAYFVNPNSLLFSLPVCLFFLLSNYKSFTFYWVTLLSAVPALTIKYLADKFYVDNPSYVTHWVMELDFTSERFLIGLNKMDQFFKYLMPVYWGGHWLIVLLIVLLSVLIFIKNKKAGISMIITSICIFGLLGVHKIHDDIGSIFLSSVRMFLSIPLLLGLSLFWYKKKYKQTTKITYVIVCIAVTTLLVKKSVYSLVVNKHTYETNFGPVAIKKVDKLKSECKVINEIIKKYDADLIIYVADRGYNVPESEFLNYGCSFFDKEIKAQSILNIFERRTWVYEKEIKKSREKVLIFNNYNVSLIDIQDSMNIKIVNYEPFVLFVDNNDKTVKELSKATNFALTR